MTHIDNDNPFSPEKTLHQSSHPVLSPSDLPRNDFSGISNFSEIFAAQNALFQQQLADLRRIREESERIREESKRLHAESGRQHAANARLFQ